MCGSVSVGEKSHRIFINTEKREGTYSVTFQISSVRANKQIYRDKIYLWEFSLKFRPA
jgi:hypothetical protein